MDSIWDAVLKLAGGSAVVALVGYGVWWAVQKVVENQLAKELEERKAELNAENQKALARLRVEMEVYQHRAGLLHEKRLEVIAELYRDLWDLSDPLHVITTTGGAQQFDDKDLNELNTRYWTTSHFFDRHKIYFSGNICEKVTDVLSLESDVVTTLTRLRSAEEVDEILELNLRLGGFTEAVRETLGALEQEFRILMGVSEQPEPSQRELA